MTTTTPVHDSYQRARARVRRLLAFYLHAAVFALVNVILVLVDLADDSSGWWFFWPLLGTTVALGVHGAVLAAGGLSGQWEERKIREYLDRTPEDGGSVRRL